MTDPLDLDAIEREWSGTKDLHDPDKQDHGYDRCEHCHYTSHPCEVFDLCETVEALIAELRATRAERNLALCAVTPSCDRNLGHD